MTKKKIIIAIICIFVVCVAAFSACTTSPMRFVSKLSYIEWRDENGIFRFRAAKDGSSGCGTIKLNGEEIPACFETGANKPVFRVYIEIGAARELGYDFDENHTERGLVFDSFVPDYLKGEQMIYSVYREVRLFGVDIGTVKLHAYPVEKSDFEIWEIQSTWRDKDRKLRIDNINYNYFLYKCFSAETELANGKTKYLTFKWLPETSGFRIYDYMEEEDNETITGQTPYLCAGTYEYDCETGKITLHFAEDELLGLQGQSLELDELE